jgi:hypothetical protein
LLIMTILYRIQDFLELVNSYIEHLYRSVSRLKFQLTSHK